MEEYNKRLTEVDAILGYLSNEEYQKIPKDVIQFIKDNKDKDYEWKFDESKTLKSQNLSRDTIAILSYLNIEYLLNEKQKAYIQKVHAMNEQKKLKEEHPNNTMNNYDDIFKKNRVSQEENEQEKSHNETMMIESKKGFFAKVVDKIKKIFKIK